MRLLRVRCSHTQPASCMLTTFSDALYDRLIAAFPATGPVDRARLGQGMPVPIFHFLEQTIERRIELEGEKVREVAAGWADHDLEELRLGREAYLRLVARHAHFPAEEWPRALRQASLLVTSHLVRPVPTLVHFIFGDDDSELPAPDVERRVGYFVAYSYLKTAVDAYLERHGQTLVRRRHLSDILTHIDRAMTADHTAADWIRTLAPLQRLAASAGFDGIPLQLLETYFDAKEAHALSARIRAWARHADRRTLSAVELETALAPEAVEPVSSRPVQNVVQAPRERTDTTESVASGAPAAVPLWKRFAKDEPVIPDDDGPAPDSSEPLWKKFRSTLGETIEPTALKVLEREVLGEVSGMRREFVTQLFGGSEEAYGRLLGAVRTARDWPEASRLLAEEVFRKFKVDIYGKTAVEFTNAVEARFRTVK